MTIRLTNPMHAITIERPSSPRHYHLVFVGDQAVALAETETEALAAKRAFEQVLAPRFTRDEAIALCADLPAHDWAAGVLEARGNETAAEAHAFNRGLRAALEALAAAGVFVDGDHEHEPDGMRAKLNAAGIR